MGAVDLAQAAGPAGAFRHRVCWEMLGDEAHERQQIEALTFYKLENMMAIDPQRMAMMAQALKGAGDPGSTMSQAGNYDAYQQYAMQAQENGQQPMPFDQFQQMQAQQQAQPMQPMMYGR